MCVAGALLNHFQQSPGSSRSDMCKTLCRPQSGHGSGSFVCLVSLVFSMVLISLSLGLFGSFVFVRFPDGF